MLKRILKLCLLLPALLEIGCTNKPSQPGYGQKTELVFPTGEKITNNNFTGVAWLQTLAYNDSIYHTTIGNVTFEPGARTHWHMHPGGQILLVTDGMGYYQEKGKPARALCKGDAVKIPPYTMHWHGASPGKQLIHVAINPNMQKGNVHWLGAVSDEEYHRAVNN